MESQLAIDPDPDPDPPVTEFTKKKEVNSLSGLSLKITNLSLFSPRKILPTDGSLPDATPDTEFHILTIEDK